MTMVGLTTPTWPTTALRTTMGAVTKTVPGSPRAGPLAKTRLPDGIEQREVQGFWVCGAGDAFADVGERGLPCDELSADDGGDRRGLVAGGVFGEQRRARLDAVEHEEPEAEREGADDAGEREEDLHADAHARGARADQARGDEGDEQDEADGRERGDEQARHGSSAPPSRGAGPVCR